MKLKQALDRVVYELNNDVNYRESWQANIAMAIYDQMRNHPEYTLHQNCNVGAIQFLANLTRDTTETELDKAHKEIQDLKHQIILLKTGPTFFDLHVSRCAKIMKVSDYGY